MSDTDKRLEDTEDLARHAPKDDGYDGAGDAAEADTGGEVAQNEPTPQPPTPRPGATHDPE